jgi:putative transposase
MNLNYRRKLKRRLPSREKEALFTPNNKNISWSMDFVSDVLTNGRRFRVLNIIDDFNREIIAMEVGTSMPAERVLRVWEKVIWCTGKPENISVDNRPEFIADVFKSWCNGNGISNKYIQPGKPTQNSIDERFNGSYRRGILDAYLFDNLNQVRELSENWMNDYNESRPHESFGDISPKAYFEKMKTVTEIKEVI